LDKIPVELVKFIKPELHLFRRLGVRTLEQIDREKYALKVLRGDFEQTGSLPQALKAVKA